MSDLHAGDDELLQKQLKYCREMLNRIKRSTYAYPFKKPVDVEEMGCPDYYDKIKHPMDLSTIKDKLDKDMYASPDQFRDDISLMLNNCYTYNPEGSYVHKCGKEIGKLFETLYAGLPLEASKKRKVEKKGMDECSRILAEILKPKNRKITWPFLKPVDKMQVPDYYDVIKNPMDLSMIQRKLNMKEYKSQEEFYQDIDLMIQNCFTYNEEGSEVYKCGQELRNLVKSAGEHGEGIREQIAALKNKISAMEREIESLQAKLNNVKNYTVSDRVEIARKIERLPEASVTGVVRIIQKYKKDLDLTQPEVEIDLKHLPNLAISEIERLISSSNKENIGEESSTSTI